MRLRALLGMALVSLIALTVSATAVQAQTGQCRGGPNNGDPCTTDADCPGECQANVAHPLCGPATPCVDVCQGGDTPGAECADGQCPGICVGGTNPGAACTVFRDRTCTGGGTCSARCGRDKCGRAFCRIRTGAALMEPADPYGDEDSDAVACFSDEASIVN